MMKSDVSSPLSSDAEGLIGLHSGLVGGESAPYLHGCRSPEAREEY
jgi:hypothetical protein